MVTVKEPDTSFRDIYLRKVDKIPQDVIEFYKARSEYFKEHPEEAYLYENKNYSDFPHTIQVDTNAASDEATCLRLINENKAFIDFVNNKLYEFNRQLLCKDGYKFNPNPTGPDHNKICLAVFADHKTVADLLSNSYCRFAWRVEVKTTISESLEAVKKHLHSAEIALQHVLGTNKLKLWVRNDSIKDYTWLCDYITDDIWNNIRITPEYSVISW